MEVYLDTIEGNFCLCPATPLRVTAGTGGRSRPAEFLRTRENLVSGVVNNSQRGSASAALGKTGLKSGISGSYRPNPEELATKTKKDVYVCTSDEA